MLARSRVFPHLARLPTLLALLCTVAEHQHCAMRPPLTVCHPTHLGLRCRRTR